MGEEKQELENWYSQKRCFSCGYDLKNDPQKKICKTETWQQQTGCPVCNRSFVE